jgi:hypothetical protein
MKLFAARAEIDADDIALLYRQLGFTTVDEGLDLVEQAYPGRPIPAKLRFLLTEIVEYRRRYSGAAAGRDLRLPRATRVCR